MVALARSDEVDASGFDINDSRQQLADALAGCDVVYHLAGINRPQDPSDFWAGNARFTAELSNMLVAKGSRPLVVFASSTQAELDNAYGRSKLEAERELADWSEYSGGSVVVFRLPNVFGKWCRPNYNSVVATFCHRIARDLPIRVDDPRANLRLAYVDDVVRALLDAAGTEARGCRFGAVHPVVELTVGELAAQIRALHDACHSPDVPDLATPFARALFATYLSYLEADDRAFSFDLRSDDRGDLAELLREPHGGQVFVSRTRPGVTRGNHYHDTKVERFMVIVGEGLIRLRDLGSASIEEYRVSGNAPQAVIIPPGVTHSIQNTGDVDLVTLFWADEVFDPEQPDTYFEPVMRDQESP